jgi:GrpB-like predicted nucleotidyltransferase (UPF0157 family)
MNEFVDGRSTTEVKVAEYDPSWPIRFEELRREYDAAMRAAGVSVVAIEHVGSTSVPGLASKPVIDCDIVVESSEIEDAAEVLTSLGFVALGEQGIPQRWAFREPPRLAGTNTYVVVNGALSHRNHILFRDLLRSDDDLSEEYARVKKSAAKSTSTIEEYGQFKGPTIWRIMKLSGLTDQEIDSIRTNQVPSQDETPR